MVAKRHHFVPRCYLEGFATRHDHKKKSDIYSFDAVQRKFFRTAIDNVALQTAFNTIDIEGHDPDAFEKAMSEVESDIGPALVRICAKESLADENDRTLLLNLIGLLHARNPRFRERNRQFREAVVKRVLDIATSNKEIWASHVKQAKAAGFLGKDETIDYEEIRKAYKPDDFKVELSNEEHIRVELEIFEPIVQRLFERKWVLVKAPENSPGFVTCDHPVCLTWSEPDPNRQRRPIGLALHGTEIFFPISPRIGVLGAYEVENGEAKFSDEQVASANGTVILNSQRQVYSKTADFKYLIDQSQKPRDAAVLVDDPKFRPTN